MFNLNDLPLLITDLPPITGLYLLGMFSLSMAVLYRLITSFLYVGELDATPIFYMLFMGSYMRLLEVRCFYKRKGDFIYFIIYIITVLNIVAIFLKMHFMASNLLMVFLYVWSRFYPDEAYNILGVIEFKGIYLPYAFAIISLLFEPNHWKNDFLSIIVGHSYFYFNTVFPQLPYGFNILETPPPLSFLNCNDK